MRTSGLRAPPRGDSEVDHIVPWSLYPVDLGHNMSWRTAAPLAVLYSTVALERAAYYLFISIFVIYLTEHLGRSTANATSLMAITEDEAWRGVMSITQGDRVWRQADGHQAVLVGRRRGWPSTRLTEIRQASMVRGGGRQPEA